MQITVKIEPSIIAFAGNPIVVNFILEATEQEESVNLKTINYKIIKDTKTVFEGIVISDNGGYASILINEIVEQFASAQSLMRNDMVSNESLLSRYKVTAECDLATAEVSHEILFGKISNRMFRYLSERKTNIFTFKFLNKKCNYLSSNRSIFYRCEAMPLYMIGTQDTMEILDGETLIYSFDADYLQTSIINFQFLKDYDNIIIRGASSDLKISFLDDPSADTITLFEFRNSYGALERLMCTGSGSCSYSKTDNTGVAEYDYISDSFVEKITHAEFREELIISTGYLTKERVAAAQELLFSDEVYLIRENTKERVSVKSNSKIPHPILEPVAIDISVAFISVDKGYTPALSPAEFGDPRVHNEKYNNNYN